MMDVQPFIWQQQRATWSVSGSCWKNAVPLLLLKTGIVGIPLEKSGIVTNYEVIHANSTQYIPNKTVLIPQACS
jgi:hypothetical protein